MLRKFVYDGREFPDPNPAWSTDEVRQNMSKFMPELANADTSTREKEGVLYVDFKKRVGTKGDHAGKRID